MKYLLYTYLLCFSTMALSQQKKQVPINPYADTARELVLDGNEHLSENAFAKAEVAYREAISLDPSSVPAKYNAGNNYYINKKYEESTASLVKAADVAQTKKEKHKAYHNLGNSLYQQQNWEGAVAAYKNALRNDPTDEETRYNLMLAKKEKDKNGGGGGGGDDENENQDKDQNQDKDKNEKDKNGEGDEKESDDGEKKETDDEGKEKEDKGEQKEDENGKPEDKEKEQSSDKGDEKKEQPKQQAPQPGQLSPQQVRSLLEAMRNEEQKTQEKINAKKQKGAKVKTEKDW
ncbi:tetratricopeptide repeat protein [Dokdonia ponticola]|uniref:Tetratricopeptide repeat protein n=1 Tax=Dokdonia ponticola TaxID=2041041 RepID=A0ABV9I1W6_9FLAO